jgi:DNA polymerase-1
MLAKFDEVWLVDFEFTSPPGERPAPICMVAREFHSGRTIRLWQDQFGPAPPFPIGARSLFVAYYASAELGCFRALGWPMPRNILDLYVEFRDRTNGLELPAARGLVGALVYHGLDHIGAVEKEEMRAIAIRGGPFTGAERVALLDYCESDVAALQRLLPAMARRLDLPRALLRGRYMAAVSAMEYYGVPIDMEMLALLRAHWDDIKDDLIRAVDEYGIYDGQTFKADRWARFLAANNIPWPLHESGRLDLTDDTFRQMAKSYPIVSPIQNFEARSPISD